MGWFKDTFAAKPIECPRGWGPVTFVLKTSVFFPLFLDVSRTCPIGGVTHCDKCRYPIEPGSDEELRLRLRELARLKGTALTEREYRIRRRLLIEAREPHPDIPGQKTATTALVLGPLGAIITGAGWYLTWTQHPGFLALLFSGVVVLGLSVSFAGISITRRRALPKPDELPPEPIGEDPIELIAELEEAREELGFLRELHQSAPPDLPKPTDKD